MDRAESDHAAYVVGVDFGTLSGRAVVVRVSDGEELAVAVGRVPARGHGRSAPVGPCACRPTGRCRCPRTTATSCATVVPAAVASAGIDPADVIGLATDFTACTMIPVLARRYATERGRRLRRPSSRVREAVEAPRGTGAGRPDQPSWPSERCEPWLPRYGGSISSEWEFAKALELYEDDRQVYDAMDAWVEAADWIVWQLTGTYIAQHLLGGLQGHPPGRGVPLT